MSNQSESNSEALQRPVWYSVECRYCGASKGEPCGRATRGFPSQWQRTKPHGIRMQDARAAYPDRFYTQAEIDAAKAFAADLSANLRVE